jgi:hypothetical protein
MTGVRLSFNAETHDGFSLIPAAHEAPVQFD